MFFRLGLFPFGKRDEFESWKFYVLKNTVEGSHMHGYWLWFCGQNFPLIWLQFRISPRMSEDLVLR